MTSGIIKLDYGNQLLYPIIPGKFYDQLKSLGIIPSNVTLGRSNSAVESANGSPLKVRGMGEYSLRYSNIHG